MNGPHARSDAPVADLLVVGGGLAGLAAEERAVRGGATARVLEAGPRAGGVVGTLAVEAEDGAGRWLLETGPHSVPSTARRFAAAVERLGLAERLVESAPAARRRFLLWRGRLRALPASPIGLVTTPLVSWRTKLRFLGESSRPFAAPTDGSEPTLAQLVTERFGADAAERVAGAFVRGVYAGEAAAIGVRSAFPRLWRGLLEHGSVLGFLKASRERGGGLSRARLLSFEGGLGELPAAYAHALGRRLETGARVERVERAGELWRAHLEDGTARDGRALLLAAPLAAAAGLLAPVVAGDPRASAALAALARERTNGVRLVHLCLARRPARWIDGFGFLVPPSEQRERGVELLGCLAPASVFAGRAPAGGASAACFYRLEGPVAHEPGEATAARARVELAAALGLAPDGLHVAATRVVDWPAGAGGIPEYAPGHDRRVAELEQALASAAPGLGIAGSYTSGVSVDDVLARGEDAAAALLRAGAEQARAHP